MPLEILEVRKWDDAPKFIKNKKLFLIFNILDYNLINTLCLIVEQLK